MSVILTNLLEGFVASIGAARVMNPPTPPTIGRILAEAVTIAATGNVKLVDVRDAWKVFVPENADEAINLEHYVNAFFDIYVEQDIISAEERAHYTGRSMQIFATTLGGLVGEYSPGEAAILELLRRSMSSRQEPPSLVGTPLLTLTIDGSKCEVIATGDKIDWYRRGIQSSARKQGFPPTGLVLASHDVRSLRLENDTTWRYKREFHKVVVDICRLGMWYFNSFLSTPESILDLVSDVLSQSWCRKEGPDDEYFDAVLDDAHHFMIAVAERQVAAWETADRVPRQFMTIGSFDQLLVGIDPIRFLRKGIPGIISTSLKAQAGETLEHSLNAFNWKLGMH